jgi:hypothetical protein
MNKILVAALAIAALAAIVGLAVFGLPLNIAAGSCAPDMENFMIESGQCYDYNTAADCVYHGCLWTDR